MVFSIDFFLSFVLGAGAGAGRNGCGGMSGAGRFHVGEVNDVWPTSLKSWSIDSKRLKLPFELNRISDPECIFKREFA